MCQEEVYDKAAALAAKLLARRPLSEHQLREKLLNKGIPEPAADYAAERMRQLGALDDAAFAGVIVGHYVRKGWGQPKIRQELRLRGIDRETAQQALEGYAPDYDAMCAQLERRLHGDCSDRTACDRACAALQRRGFSYGEIRQAMEQYRADCTSD